MRSTCGLHGAMVAAMLAMTAFASEARAESPTTPASVELGDDEVTLANGGTVRGTVLVNEPGQRVVIKVYGSDEPRVLQWAEVADVELGKHAPSRGATPGYGSSQAEGSRSGVVGYSPGISSADAPEDVPASPEPEKTVRVHIVSDDPETELYQVITATEYFGPFGVRRLEAEKLVCKSPCDESVDARYGTSYFVAGPGIRGSRRFSLSGHEGDMTLRVNTGSRSVLIGGVVMTPIGGAAMLAGGVMTALGHAVSLEPFDIVGPVALGVGAAMLGGGIAMIVGSRTGVDVEEGKPQARAPRYWLGEF